MKQAPQSALFFALQKFFDAEQRDGMLRQTHDVPRGTCVQVYEFDSQLYMKVLGVIV